MWKIELDGNYEAHPSYTYRGAVQQAIDYTTVAEGGRKPKGEIALVWWCRPDKRTLVCAVESGYLLEHRDHKQIRDLGWSAGEFTCPFCMAMFGKNLLGESPHALVHQHLAKYHPEDESVYPLKRTILRERVRADVDLFYEVHHPVGSDADEFRSQVDCAGISLGTYIGDVHETLKVEELTEEPLTDDAESKMALAAALSLLEDLRDNRNYDLARLEVEDLLVDDGPEIVVGRSYVYRGGKCGALRGKTVQVTRELPDPADPECTMYQVETPSIVAQCYQCDLNEE